MNFIYVSGEKVYRGRAENARLDVFKKGSRRTWSGDDGPWDTSDSRARRVVSQRPGQLMASGVTMQNLINPSHN
jgi:hypothetical protein